MAPEKIMSQPHPLDLQSEPFWTMNKYFTQHQVAVPGPWGMLWPPPHLLSRL